MSAESKITAARTSLTLEEPFFGALVLSLKMKADPTCGTAWTDGRHIGYCPAFIETLTHRQLVGLLVHKVMHVAAGHPWRREQRNPRQWNMACDKAINNIIRDSGHALPADGLYAEGDEVGKSAEWIYGRAQYREDQEGQPEPAPEPEENKDEDADEDESGDSQPGDGAGEEEDEDGNGDGQDDGDGEGDGEGESGDEEGEGNGQGPGKPDFGEVRDAPTGVDEDGDEAPTEQEWKEKVAVAAVTAKAMGKLPAGLERMCKDALKPQVDVRALLLKFFQERAAADYRWTRPNKRYMAQGIYLPGLHSEGLGEVAFMVDTSGSMDDVALAHARAIVEDVIRECAPQAITVVYADDEVSRVDRFEQHEELVWQPKGGGGTSFVPALEYIEQNTEAVCIVCITDLYGVFPQVPPSRPVLWLSTVERNVAPFGETVFADQQ